MAKSPGRRQNELTPDEQQKDGELVYTPNEMPDAPLTDPDFNMKPAPLEDEKEAQNNETSSTGGDLPNRQQNNVNHGSIFDDAIVFVLPMP